MRSWPSTRSQQDNSQAESSSMNNSDSVVVSKAGVAASSSSSQLQQQQHWYHPQQLLPQAGTTVPRRGSLPISRSQLRQLQLEGRLKKRPPSTEIYVASDRTRLDDTPEQIRKFLDTIKLNDNSEEDSEVFVESSRASSRCNSLKLKNKKGLNGSIRRGSDLTSSLKRSSSSSKTKVNSTSKMADIELPPEYIEDVEEAEKTRLSAQERKALMATTQLTELEMVELWNQYKFNFPTGKVNLKQLKQLVRKVFPRCTQPDFVVENIQKVFDSEQNGCVSVRELLIAFSMSMKGTPREKLHWAFRLYDADESETIEEEELEDVFCRLFSIAKNIERAAEEARNPKPKKPRTPTPPPVEEEKKGPQEESPPPEKKKTSKANKKKIINKMSTAAVVEINVKTMSNKMNTRQEKTKAKTTEAEQRKLKREKREEKKRAEAEKARLEAEAAAQAEAEAAAAAEKAARAENGEESEEEEEEEIDPSVIAKENARAIFKMLDINRDGQLDEDEFVDGCLADEMFLEMLLTFNCDFLWGDGIC